LRGPISGFGVFLGKALSGKSKAGEISNAEHIGMVCTICNGGRRRRTGMCGRSGLPLRDKVGEVIKLTDD
jgi:hypothetical protein